MMKVWALVRCAATAPARMRSAQMDLHRSVTSGGRRDGGRPRPPRGRRPRRDAPPGRLYGACAARCPGIRTDPGARRLAALAAADHQRHRRPQPRQPQRRRAADSRTGARHRADAAGHVTQLRRRLRAHPPAPSRHSSSGGGRGPWAVLHTRHVLEVGIPGPENRRECLRRGEYDAVGEREWYSSPSWAERIASGTSRSTTRPCCISAAACRAASSPRCRSTCLNTSKSLMLGTMRRSGSSTSGAKKSAFSPSAMYSNQPEESTTFIGTPAGVFTSGRPPARVQWSFRVASPEALSPAGAG
jgi:hypothetical protein